MMKDEFWSGVSSFIVPPSSFLQPDSVAGLQMGGFDTAHVSNALAPASTTLARGKLSPAATVVVMVALAVVYFAAGKLGLSLAFDNKSASPVWPPTGLALAAALAFGFRVWPAVFVGAFLVNLTTPTALLPSLVIALGNTLEAITGAWLVRRFSGGLAVFDRAGNIFPYVCLAAAPCTAISATIGVVTLCIAGYDSWARFFPVWFTWWTGDFVSALVVAPLLIVYFVHRWKVPTTSRMAEAIAMVLTSLAVSCIVFGGGLLRKTQSYPLEYVCLPVLIWGAFRFLQIGAVTSAAVISFVAVAGTCRGTGPFAAVANRNDSLVLVQLFVGVTTLTALVLAALTSERKAAEAEREDLLRREGLARAEAERASNAKDQFIAVLSHELRTPLTPVMLSASALSADPNLPASIREDLQMIRRNVELEARLIDDLLDHTRITRGKLHLQMQPTDLHELIRRAVQTTLRDAPMQVHVALVAQNAHVEGDPGRLQQVFMNLLSNALKFTPASGSISVTSRNTDDGAAIVVDVADTGEGIDPQLLPKLFTAFEQGPALNARRTGGLGLGLAISRALVEVHHGKLSVHSDGKGRGSTFSISLPTLAPDTSPVTSPVASEVLPFGAPPPDLSTSEPASVSLLQSRSLKILLVEDHDNTLSVMRRLLATWNHKVTCATSVASAIQAIEADKFDLVISDLGLPDGLGYQIMQSAKQKEGLRGIVISGYGTDTDVTKSMEAGFAEHLIKPITISALEEAIARVTR